MLNRLIGRVYLALAERKGISAMEYAILGAAIIAAVSALSATLTTGLGEVFNTLISNLKNAVKWAAWRADCGCFGYGGRMPPLPCIAR